jgi:hypothetical protein
MVLQKIKEGVALHKRFLQSERRFENAHWWESLAVFQTNWDISARDIAAMYDASLQNSESHRLWFAESHEPKRMMLRLMAMQPHFAEDMFRDLFNENRSVEGRADRFMFHCDELLAAFREANPASVENSHYHGLEMVSLYLAFHYPEHYALFDFDAFTHTLRYLEAKDVPQVPDFARFVKSSKILFKFLSEDAELQKLHLARLDPKRHYMPPSMLIVSEFCALVARARPILG